MSDRFFVDRPITGQRAELVGPEAQHASKVMRLKVGDRLTLFDGRGAQFEAQVESIGKQSVVCQIDSKSQVDRELSIDLTLLVALPKGDRQRWMVEKAVELGVRRLIPLQTQRGVAQPAEKALQRLRRTVIEASKQSGRNVLMEVCAPQTLTEFQPAEGALSLIADPMGDRLATSPDQRTVHLAVGPEGGFTSEELESARRAGWKPISMGPRILRVETAAVALAAWISLGG